MSSHASHRQEGRKHKHHRPLQRGSALGGFRVARTYGRAEAPRQALDDDLEAERLQTTRRANPADDDEDPTRRGGGT